MRPKEAHQLATVTAAECVKWIDKVLNAGFSPNCYRNILNDVRDKLHHVCRLFEDGTDAETFEDDYLPLFDALGFITDAVNARPVHRPGIERCRETLLHLMEAGVLS